MPSFLVGILFHEPEDWALRQRGVIEDHESSTGLFVDADSGADAIAWAEQVGAKLLRFANQDPDIDWKEMGYYCWIVECPETSNWKHCLPFFQRVKVGESPDFSQMGSEAYAAWTSQNPNAKQP